MCSGRSTSPAGASATTGWRERGAPVIHVRHRSAEPEGTFVPGTPAFEFKPEAEPLDGEPVLTKDVHSAFIGTDLEERLRARGHLDGRDRRHDHRPLLLDDSTDGRRPRLRNVGPGRRDGHVRPRDGRRRPADVMHRTALASLHDEFAEVIATDAALARL
jgi:hypothetical protein